MIPVTQTIMHDPENGQVGNCFQAAIASVLELPLERVPHFALNESTWWLDANKWLWTKHGLFLQNYPVAQIEKDNPFLLDDTHYHLLVGESPRGPRHNCVGLAGKLVWDPHPSREGLSTTDTYDFFFRKFEAPARCMECVSYLKCSGPGCIFKSCSKFRKE